MKTWNKDGIIYPHHKNYLSDLLHLKVYSMQTTTRLDLEVLKGRAEGCREGRQSEEEEEHRGKGESGHVYQCEYLYFMQFMWIYFY